MAVEPSLRQLRYLVALADTLHFGEAAAICHVSQPNLSAQLRELERTLGAQLVERTSRQVLLTPVGAEIVGRAREVLSRVDELTDAAAVGTDPFSGPLRLGVIPTISPYVLPKALPAVRRSHPELELHLTEDYTDRLVSRLVDGELDLLLLALPVESATGISTKALIDEPFVVAAPRRHRLSDRETVAVEDIDVSEMLLLRDGHCLRDQALAACNVDRAARRQVVEGSSLSTLVQMVANGLGITLLPQTAVAVDVPSGNEVAIRSFHSPRPGRTIGLAWRTTSPRTAVFDELGKILCKEIGRLIERGRKGR